MSDLTPTVLGILLIFVALPVVLLWVRDRARRARQSRSPAGVRLAERRTYEDRILRPDWGPVERHLGRPVPEALRELYADRALVTRTDLPYGTDHTISTFDPLDEQAMSESRTWLGFGGTVIATTDFGDCIYLRPGAAEPDRVYLTYHDGGDTEVFAESVADMVRMLRDAARP